MAAPAPVAAATAVPEGPIVKHRTYRLALLSDSGYADYFGAANVTAALLCLAIIAIASPLFWFLIRAMARIQLPARRPQEPVG